MQACGTIGSVNDLELVRADIAKLTALVEQLVTVVETRRTLVDRFDDRLSRAERLQRSLGSTALQLVAARAITHMASGAVSGAIAGGVVAWFLALAK